MITSSVTSPSSSLRQTPKVKIMDDHAITTHALWLRVIVVLGLVVLAISATLVVVQLAARPSTRTAMSDREFLILARRAAKEKFVAMYVVKGNASPFMATGRIFLASDPKLASSHATNDEGYSGFGQYYAYVFRENNGALVQWIQQGPNVSWCLRWPRAQVAKLECTGPSSYVPSNGYAMQALPFAPTTLLGPVQNFFYGQPRRRPPVVTERSTSIGPLHCLLQTSGLPHLRTCIDHQGFIVLSTYRRGPYWWSVTLTSLHRDAPSKDFTTLLKSSGKVPLPPLG